jgi:class 3 adenylate cyclase
MLFAATYPERTTALVMWLSAIANPYDATDDEGKAFIDEIEEFIGDHWGDGAPLRLIAGTGAPQDPSIDDVLCRFERNAATPAAAQAVWRRIFVADARPFLTAVAVPTLFVAHTGDNLVPVELVRENASKVSGAKVVEVPVDGHWSWETLTAPDLDAIEEFLTGQRQVPVSDRVLATILYTDIVGSTERAAAMGDRRWRALLDEHDAVTRRELERFRGREVNTTGDGFLAAFDGPARAIECAQSIVRQGKVLGLDIRAGLHAGECEVRGGDLAGITLHVGARVAGLAGPSEVLVSRTVRDLVVGSDLTFEDRGAHTLKGLPGEWQVFASVTAG